MKVILQKQMNQEVFHKTYEIQSNMPTQVTSIKQLPVLKGNLSLVML